MRPFPVEGVAAGPDNDYTVNTTICHLKSPTTSYRCQSHDFDLAKLPVPLKRHGCGQWLASQLAKRRMAHCTISCDVL